MRRYPIRRRIHERGRRLAGFDDGPMAEWQQHMRDLADEGMPRYGDFPRRRRRGRGGEESMWLDVPPPCDVTERPGELVVETELPGMSEEDVEITVDEHELVISGEKKDEQQEEDTEFRHVERSYGFFERVIDLPAGVEVEKVKATFENGVLRVTVPLAEEAKSKRTKVSVEAK